jgi:hypothetical protein
MREEQAQLEEAKRRYYFTASPQAHVLLGCLAPP